MCAGGAKNIGIGTRYSWDWAIGAYINIRKKYGAQVDCSRKVR